MTAGNASAAVALVLGLLLVVPVLVFALQMVAQTWRRPALAVVTRAEPALARPRVALLVPAHDEESGIAQTLATLLHQLRDGDRVLVVADNCSDATAAVARAAGADVVERVHDDRGKGFALAFGMQHLSLDPPQAVVIVDADCELAPEALNALLEELQRTGRPVQALYLMLGAPDSGLSRRLAEFAWRVRNRARPSGGARMGMPCQLMGTGMAFTWDMLRGAPLDNASIVEDMKLGIDLALEGRPPVFCERALVTSRFPDSVRATQTQRTRWEHGHLEMILREVPSLMAFAVRRFDVGVLGLALDLCVPPLALLAALLALAWTLSLASLLLGGGMAAFGLASLLLGLFSLAVLIAWITHGRDLVRLAEMLSVPWYILAKIPLYFRFIFKRQKQWVRTDRKLEDSDKP
jgi:cellulose synthase/poly-beta-1,6-N-acetylglucosamine synthase-like glycosyltransferase